jgi:hypothetical protein
VERADFLAEPIESARGKGLHEWSGNELQSLAPRGRGWQIRRL